MDDITLNKLPPQAIEAEESILSACMLGAAQDVVEILSADDFYRSSHIKIFKIIEDLISKKINIDLTTVVDALRNNSELNEIGGVSFITRLIDVIPSATSIHDYGAIIKAQAQKRQIIKICAETIQHCYNNKNADLILTKHDQELSKIKLHKGNFIKMGDKLPELLERWEQMSLNPGATGLKCGLSDVDRKLGGFQGSTFYVIGGRPGMGKTAFGMRIARGVAHNNFPVFEISLEMSTAQLVTREISCVSGVDGERFLTGDLNKEHWRRIARSSDQVSELSIWVDDTPQVTIKECQSKIRQFYRKHGKCLVIIDYLDYIQGNISDRKDLEIGTITKALKASAKEHDIPIVLFCQLNRNCEKRDNKRPEIRDLRNSGEIEQDADIIAFLYRDEFYNQETKYPGVAELIIRKFRHGKIGTVFLTWIDHRTTFESIAR